VKDNLYKKFNVNELVKIQINIRKIVKLINDTFYNYSHLTRLNNFEFNKFNNNK